MFQAPRALFHRSQSGTTSVATDPQSKAQDTPRREERHPAMRGLDVSPVHGHHCICGRCEVQPRKDAA